MSRINTNIISLTAARMLNNNTTKLNTALERLSTGLRINSAKDDPAGLIASETLRSEIVAIEAAITNAQRADNIVSLAEGALQEVSALLIELEDLVDRSANEAGLSAEEVKANQLQIDSILDTINRISTSTEFQGKKLLNGTLDYNTSAVNLGASTGSALTHVAINSARIPNGGSRTVVVEVTNSAETAQLIFAGSATGAGTTTIEVAGQFGTEQLSFSSGTAASSVVAAINGSSALTGVSATISGTGANTRILINSTDYGSDAFVSIEALNGTFTVTGGTSATRDTGEDASVTVNGVTAITDGLKASVRSASLSLDLVLSTAFGTQTTNSKTFYITGGGANFSIAPTLGLNATASLGIQSVSTGSLGTADTGFLQSLGSGQANQLTSKNYESAQRIIRESNTQVSSLRGRLGSFQKNTLGATINSLNIALENTLAAESAIRDADFAEETSNLTRQQILVNSGTAVLQLANAAPQSILALLS
jgi:flagellin